MTDYRDEDTKPYALACPQCGASPVRPGRTQVRTTLLSAGELDDWLALTDRMQAAVASLTSALPNLPGEAQVALEQLRDGTLEINQRLLARRHEIGG
jgi:hypothetical protein